MTADLDRALAAVNRSLDGANATAIVAAAVQAAPRGRLAVVSSFGTESAALLKIVADVDRTVPVLFLDTGWLFKETLAYRDLLLARLGLTNVRTITPSKEAVDAQDPQRDLWFTDPDACCALRKVEPLTRALTPFYAWINGRKQYHGGARARLPIVEADGRRLKFNPLARMSQAESETVFAAAGLPRHPLAAQGFTSVGCMPCTTRTQAGEAVRAGRWRGRGKTECGIHLMALEQRPRE